MMHRSILVLLLLCYLTSAQDTWQLHYKAFSEDKIKDLDGWVAQNIFKEKVISTCGKVQLVGGFEVFGKRATITKQIRVPPHYKLKIQVQLWRIDSWDNEKMQIYIDGFLWEARWGYTDGGQQLCGSSRNDKFNEKVYEIEILVPHNSPTVTIIMTSTLDEDASNESWGFKDFRLSYLECPAECGICSSNKPEDCQNWQQTAFSWAKAKVDAEGWTLDEGFARTMECSGITIFGGQKNIGKGSVLSKIFPDLPPHYKVLVKFQFWKIDSWDNEQFQVSADNKQVFTQNFQWNEGVQLCGVDTGKNQEEGWAEKVVNVEFQVVHQQPSIKLSMTSTLDEGMDNESWGIRDFFLFVAKCRSHCSVCSGPGVADCLECEPSYQLNDGKCIDTSKWIVGVKDFTPLDSGNDLKGWDFQHLVKDAKNPFNECEEKVKLTGGFERFGPGTFAVKQLKMPKHERIRIKTQLWKLGQWEGEEIYIRVGEQKVFSVNLGYNDPGQVKLCSKPNNWKDTIIEVDETIEHSEQLMKIEIGSTLEDVKDSIDSDSLQNHGASESSCYYLKRKKNVQFSTVSVTSKANHTISVRTQNPSKEQILYKYLQSHIDIPVKSIKIPKGTSLIGFQQEQYKGGKIVFTESQECIQDYKFSMMQISQEIHMSNQDHHFLRSKQLI